MKQPRLVPMVILAATMLLALKVLAFLHGDFGAVASEIMVGSKADPFAGRPIDPIITGSSDGGHGGGEESKAAPAHDSGAKATSEAVEPSKVQTGVSSERPAEAKPIPGSELLSEVEILKRLAERRKQLDKLEEELMMRENLLKATEDRVSKQVDELKTIETKVKEGGMSAEDEKKKQMGDLVKMYEAMKPKDAARVFDGLDPKLLVDIARLMNPKKLGDIVAKMSSETAQKLTMELARPTAAPVPQQDVSLPKIQGKS